MSLSIDEIVASTAQLRISDFAGTPSHSDFARGNPLNHTTFWLPLLATGQEALKDLISAVVKTAKEKERQGPQITLPKDLLARTTSQGVLEIEDTSDSPIICTSINRPPTQKPDGSLFMKGQSKQGIYLVSFFDFKVEKNKNGSFREGDLGQLMAYAHCVLMVHQTHRRSLTTFIANADNVQFLRAERDSGSSNGVKFSISHMESIRRRSTDEDIPKGLLQLYAFFSAGPAGLGYEDIGNPFDTCALNSFLGEGISSRVFSVHDNPTWVVKIFQREEEAPIEAAALQKIAGLKYVPTLIEHKDNGLIISPRAIRITAGVFMLKHALQALEVLKEAHQLGLVHRDFRPANLLLVKDTDDILVNDWGFATEVDKPALYSGTLMHASDKILTLLSKGETEFGVSYADDLESYVRTMFVLTYPRFALSVNGAVNRSAAATQILEKWSKRFPPAWIKIQEIARAKDYDGLRKALSDILP